MKKIILTFTFLLSMKYAQAQQEMPLYPNGVPNAKQVPNTQKSVTDKNGVVRISEVTVPTLTVYPADADKANGTAVIICPGGGYAILAASHEGSDVASVFNKMGVTAFVLKYRLPNDNAQIDKSIAPLQDAQQALRTVRKEASKYGINPNKIGIMGFSAGGHLASTAGTHFDKQVGEVTSEVSVRPDFMILGYPVITFKDFGHAGSRINLVGKTADQILIDEYSNELHVTKETPPTFLVHAGDDMAVPVKNSLVFYEGLQKNGVLAELVINPKGGHGFGLNNKTTNEKWMDNVKNWMDSLGLLSK